MSAWMGYNAVPVEYVRHERAAGKTKYSLKKMLKLAADGIFGFSTKPLSMLTYMGTVVLAAALAGIVITAVWAAAAGVPGWLWGLWVLIALDGVILLCMGVQGEYIQRIYDEVQGRPLYVVKERIN